MVATALYQDILSDGITRECARAVLPQATLTTMPARALSYSSRGDSSRATQRRTGRCQR